MSLIFRNLYRGSSALKCRNFHVSSSVHESEAFKRFMFNFDGYNKYGLLHDDLLNPEHSPLVEEAVRRLPDDEKMRRTYRCIRAHQAEVNNSLLPKEQWTKYEDDHFYLQPYLEEVVKETLEREEWEANH